MFLFERMPVKAALLGAVCSASSLLAADPAPQPTNQELLDKVARLEAKVEKLEAEHGANSTDVQATKANLKIDADNNNIYSLNPIKAAYRDGGLRISSTDGLFTLHPFFHFVFRDIVNDRRNATGPSTPSDTDNGFEVRRMEGGVEGTMFSKDLGYIFLWDTDRHNGRPILELAFAQYHLADTPWSIKAGQMNDPFDHEQMGSSAKFVAVERTLTVATLADGDAFTHAVSLVYDNNGPFRSEVAFTDGINSQNQNFQDYPTNLADWGVAGRAEYKFFGDWSQYSDASARGNTKDMFVVGAGVDYTEAGPSAAFRHVIDAQYETAGGLGLYGAYLGRATAHNQVGAGVSANTYDWSVRAQASYALNEHWEPFVRYDYMYLDGKSLAPGLHGAVHEITAGFNYYIFGQNAKFSFDLDYLPTGSPVSDDGAGILSNGGGSQLLVRTNFQLVL